MFNFVIFSKSWVSDPDPRCYSGTGNLIRCHPDPQHKYFVHKAGPGSALVWILTYHSIHVFHPLYHPMIFRILFNFFRPFLCPVYFTTGTYLVCRVSYLGAGSKASLCVLACDTFFTFSVFLINEITHTPFLYSSMCCCCCWLKEAPTPPVIILSDVTTWVRGKGNHLSEYLGMSHTPLALSLSPTFPSSTVSYVTLRTTTGNPRVFFFIDRSVPTVDVILTPLYFLFLLSFVINICVQKYNFPPPLFCFFLSSSSKSLLGSRPSSKHTDCSY